MITRKFYMLIHNNKPVLSGYSHPAPWRTATYETVHELGNIAIFYEQDEAQKVAHDLTLKTLKPCYVMESIVRNTVQVDETVL